MKKKCVGLLLVAGILLTACGNSEGEAKKTVDTQALAQSLVNELSYDGTLSELEQDQIANYIDLVEGTTGIMYMSDGETSEEVAVFTTKDAASAEQMKENVELFLEDQKSSFEDYLPEESKRIEDAVLVVNDKYVVLSVSEDASAAKKIIEEALQ